MHKRAAKDKRVSVQNETVSSHPADTSYKTSVTSAIVTDTLHKVVAPVVDSEKIWEAVLGPVWQQRLAFRTFSGKAKIHYEAGENSQDFTANFRVRKDSLIWVTITAMGGMVQAARLQITPDSLQMINYLDKETTVMPITDVARLLPAAVDFQALQNLILGQPPRDGKIARAGRDGEYWTLDVADTGYMQHISYRTNDSAMVQGQIRTVKENGPMASIDYAEYEVADRKKVSTRRVINIQNGSEVYLVDIKFTSQSFDQDLDYPFVLPKNYTRKK